MRTKQENELLKSNMELLKENQGKDSEVSEVKEVRKLTVEEKLKIENMQYLKQIDELKRENFNLKYEVLNLRTQNERTQLTGSINEVTNRLQNNEDNYKKFILELNNKYGISSTKWGFDPLTGEIIEPENKK